MANATSTQLQELYVAYFGRAADPSGLDYWTESGITTAAFAANMYAQPEFESAYGSLSIESQVNQIYLNLFDREADVAGLTYWSQQIRLGNLQLAEIANDLIWAAQNNSGSSDDKTALSNRSAAAVAYTAKIKETTAGILAYQPLNDGLTAGSTFAAGDNITAAKNYLATIDKDTASTAAGIAASVATVISAGVPTVATEAKILTLVTTQDSVTGGAGNDTINGVIVGAGVTGTTIQAGDVIAGGAGTDTLAIAVSGNAVHTLSGVQVSGVEKVLLTNFDANAGDTTIDTVLLGSPATVGLSSSSATGDTVFTGMTALTNAEMKNGSADLTLSHASTAVSGSSDAISLGVVNTSAGTFTAAGIETLTIDATTTASTLTDVVIANATALNVTGSANLTINNDVDFAANSSTEAAAIDGTFDASAFTGALDITFNTGDVVSATGGSGDDNFEFTSGFDKYDVVNGGAGTDTLAVEAGATALTKTDFANVTNTEVLELNPTDDAATFNADGTAFSTVKATGKQRTYTVTGSIDVAGEDLSYVLNGTTYTIDTAGTTDSAAEIGAELVASIDALDGFSATGAAAVVITADSGDVVDFSALTNTTDTTDDIAVNTGDLKDLALTNLTAETIDVVAAQALAASLKDASGSSDVMNINLTSPSSVDDVSRTIESISVPNVETINLNTSGLSANTVDYIITTLTDGGTTDLNTLNITGSSSLDLSGTITATDLTTVDASTFTGDLKLAGVAEDQTITGGSGADEFIFAATLLDNDDTVTGGSGTDKLTATTTALTATTGALSISGVETINLTNAGAQVIDASKITGATELAVLTNTTSTTITNLAAGTAVGAGFNDTDGAVAGLFDVSLADATGTSDALTFNLNDTEAGGYNLEVKATGIETVTFDVTDDTDTSNADATLDVDSLNASSIIVTGSTLDTGNALSLGTLDTDTTSVDASGYKGILTATAGAATATSFTVGGDRLHVLTGSSKNDTFTVGSASDSTTNADVTIDGNGGTDVVNISIGDGAADFDGISDIDTLNITVVDSSEVTTAAADSLDGVDAATAINVTGGNSLSSVTLGGAGDTLSASNSSVFDFSGYSGKITDMTWAVDAFDDGETAVDQSVIGTALEDTLSASYDADADASVALNMTGIETFDVDLADSSVEMVFDMTKATGLTQINLTDASSESVEFNNLVSGVTIDATTDNAVDTTVEIKPATVSGTETQAFNVSALTADDDLSLVIADVETVTIKPETAEQVDLDLSGLSMTTAGQVMTVTFSGTNNVEVTALNADVTTLDASGMGTGGAVVQTGRSATAASTYTGSAGADTFIMMNSGDVLAAGAGSDTLDINYQGILGGLNINLNATNQLVTIDGGGASGTITGFVNVDVAGYTGGSGARITGLTTDTDTAITGTAVVDVITTGKGDDTITDSAGADVISTGAGDDNLTITAAGNVVTFGDGADTLTLTDTLVDSVSVLSNGSYAGGDGSDTVSISDAATIIDADMVDFTTMEILDFTTASSTATLATNFTAAGFTTIDATGASLALTAGSTLGTAAAPLEITGYAFNNAAAKFFLGGTDDAADAATTGYSVTTGIYTHTAGTATFSDFFAAIAATAAAGDVAGFVSGGNTYVFGEGANTNDTDDVFLKLTGVTATAISDAGGTQAANTVFVA